MPKTFAVQYCSSRCFCSSCFWCRKCKHRHSGTCGSCSVCCSLHVVTDVTVYFHIIYVTLHRQYMRKYCGSEFICHVLCTLCGVSSLLCKYVLVDPPSPGPAHSLCSVPEMLYLNEGSDSHICIDATGASPGHVHLCDVALTDVCTRHPCHPPPFELLRHCIIIIIQHWLWPVSHLLNKGLNSLSRRRNKVRFSTMYCTYTSRTGPFVASVTQKAYEDMHLLMNCNNRVVPPLHSSCLGLCLMFLYTKLLHSCVSCQGWPQRNKAWACSSSTHWTVITHNVYILWFFMAVTDRLTV